MIGAWRQKLSGTYWPIPIAIASICLVMLLLFAFPMVSGWIGFALPFLALGLFAAMLLGMNIRWRLWQGSRPLFFSIADIGFLLCFGAFGLYSFAYISDAWTNLPYVLIGFAIVAVFRVAFLEFEAWWLGILLCGVLAMVFGAYIAFTLGEPAWFFDFSAALLLLWGIVLLLGGSILALLESPSRSRRELWPGWLKVTAGGLGLGLAAALAISAVMTVANREVVEPSEAAGARQVIFEGGRTDFRFVTWTAGPVQLLITNRDLRVHTFTVEELGIDVAVGPGSQKLIRFELPPGDYGFECRVPGHSERSGIHVQ